MTTPIPALEASSKGFLGIWRAKHFLNKESGKLTPFTRRFIICTLIGVFISASITTVLLARSTSQWQNIQKVEAVAVEDSKNTEDLGQVAKVSYLYDGKEYTEIAKASGSTLAGDVLAVNIEKNTGSPIYRDPEPLGMAILMGILLGFALGFGTLWLWSIWVA